LKKEIDETKKLSDIFQSAMRKYHKKMPDAFSPKRKLIFKGKKLTGMKFIAIIIGWLLLLGLLLSPCYADKWVDTLQGYYNLEQIKVITINHYSPERWNVKFDGVWIKSFDSLEEAENYLRKLSPQLRNLLIK